MKGEIENYFTMRFQNCARLTATTLAKTDVNRKAYTIVIGVGLTDKEHPWSSGKKLVPPGRSSNIKDLRREQGVPTPADEKSTTMVDAQLVDTAGKGDCFFYARLREVIV